MTTVYCEKAERQFQSVSQLLFNELQRDESLTLNVQGEHSQFVRFNHGKIRQCGHVEDASLSLKLVRNGRTVDAKLQFVVSDHKAEELNASAAKEFLANAREFADALPEDPYAIQPENFGSSQNERKGATLSAESCCERLMSPLAGLDAAGYYGSGPSFQGLANSKGQRHWFSSESFFVDYSLYTPSEKAIKLYYSGNEWDDAKYKKQIETASNQLKILDAPARAISPGKYKVYFAPAAVSDLLSMLSWNGVSEGSLRRGESALTQLRDKKKTLSQLFSLRENFDAVHVPRFNSFGEMSASKLDIFSHGKLSNTLISRRTAKEYDLQSNAATQFEGLQAPEMLPGKLSEKDILPQLDTGLFLSNLHYLNWSDVQGGRVTGMTRYACFWVENGKIVAPIENLRWDESLFHYFGEGLLAVTDFQEFIPDTSTYGSRSIGGTLAPGMLVKDFTFTL